MPVLHLPNRDRADNRRHHSQVRMNPWATFFNGVEPTNKLSATALTTGEISTGCFYRAQAGRGPGRFFRMSRSALSFAPPPAGPLDLQLLRLHLSLAGKGVAAGRPTAPAPIAQHVLVQIQIPGAPAPPSPPARVTNFTASSLNSRLNRLRSIIHLRFHRHILTRCPRNRQQLTFVFRLKLAPKIIPTGCGISDPELFKGFTISFAIGVRLPIVLGLA